jgi:hypothetical protein
MMMKDDKTYRINEVRGALLYPTFLCGLLLLLGAIALDGGMLARYGLASVGLHWAIAVYLYVRRRNCMTRGDVLLFQAGVVLYTPLLFVAKTLILRLQREPG